MTIEKLKNYNQKLLALLGTIVVLMAAVGLIMLIFVGITEMAREIRYNRQDDGILSDEKIEELQQENRRKQVISYDFPQLIDTLNSVYIIPVGHKTLNAAEYIDEEVLGLLDIHGSVKVDSRYSKSYYGSFNNLLIYDLKNKSIVTLFDERINFNEIKTEIIGDEIIILFAASIKDTHKDGVINLKDLKSLYIYSLSANRLRKISEDNLDVQHYDFAINNKDLLIRFGIDKDSDGQYDNSSEPTIIKKYDYENDKLIDIIDKETSENLQKLLEGTKI
jgi:hypothetical protein